jgi:urease accessory protein UreG
VLTGTRDYFMKEIDGPSLGEIFKPAAWEKTRSEGTKVLQRLLDLPMPVVGVANGPAMIHSEYLLLSDIHIASECAPALVDFFIYVIDVAAGDKIPRKDGPGISQSDILVINKIDLAPYVDASLAVMGADSKLMRGEKPFIFTNCRTGEGVPEVVSLIRHNVLFDLPAAPEATR